MGAESYFYANSCLTVNNPITTKAHGCDHPTKYTNRNNPNTTPPPTDKSKAVTKHIPQNHPYKTTSTKSISPHHPIRPPQEPSSSPIRRHHLTNTPTSLPTSPQPPIRPQTNQQRPNTVTLPPLRSPKHTLPQKFHPHTITNLNTQLTHQPHHPLHRNNQNHSRHQALTTYQLLHTLQHRTQNLHHRQTSTNLQPLHIMPTTRHHTQQFQNQPHHTTTILLSLPQNQSPRPYPHHHVRSLSHISQRLYKPQFQRNNQQHSHSHQRNHQNHLTTSTQTSINHVPPNRPPQITILKRHITQNQLTNLDPRQPAHQPFQQ